MAAWDELDRATAVIRILVVLVGLIVVVAARVIFDATDDDALGWTGYFVQSVLVLALAGLCLGRLLVLSHNGVEAKKAGEPISVSPRFVVVALVVVLFGVRVIRGDGQGDLDAVGLGIQLAALLGLVLIAARWLYQKIRDK